MTVGLLLLSVALVAANGFFVGAEFAVLAARRGRLEPLLRTSRSARTALRAIEQLPLMISACQFGITLASLGLGALGEPAVAALLIGPFEALHLPHQLIHRLPGGIAAAVDQGIARAADGRPEGARERPGTDHRHDRLVCRRRIRQGNRQGQHHDEKYGRGFHESTSGCRG